MAADLKAVGSTAADQEEHSQKVVRDVHLTAKESRSEKGLAGVSAKAEKGSHSVTDRAEALARAAKENLSQATGRADHSVKTVSSAATDQEGHSAKTGRADLSERTVSPVQTDREDHSAKAESVREEVSERTAREGRWEATERVQVREIQQEKALHERISTISAMKTKAESTR